MSDDSARGLTLDALQRQVRDTFGAKDGARGDTATFLWLVEEVGELATALRTGSPADVAAEMADVLAWLVTLANVRSIDLQAAFQRKYAVGCPSCRCSPCQCDPAQKP